MTYTLRMPSGYKSKSWDFQKVSFLGELPLYRTFHSEATHQYQQLKGTSHNDPISSFMLHCARDAFIISIHYYISQYIFEDTAGITMQLMFHCDSARHTQLPIFCQKLNSFI